MREEKFRWRPESQPADAADWAEVQELERDLLLLYHQLSEYDYIMGDLDYGDVFALPYWRYINPTGLDLERAVFIQQGCLIMLLAIAWAEIDGSCSFLRKINTEEPLQQLLGECTPLNPTTERLLGHVRSVVDAALTEQPVNEAALAPESKWAHTAFVRGYFEERSRAT